MTINDFQIKNSNGEFESIFPLSIAQGGTGAISNINACKNLYAFCLKGGTKLNLTDEKVDLNSLKTPGIYHWSTSATLANCTNKPTNLQDAFRLIVSNILEPNSATYIGQHLFTYKGFEWYRYIDWDGTWSDWIALGGQNAYPVGSIYMSYSSTSPASLFGGSWSQISGRFLYCTTSTGTGGNNSHTLTIDQIPRHSHYADDTYSGISFLKHISSAAASDGAKGNQYLANGTSVNSWNQWSRSTGTTGSGKSHNNMPAYQGVYCWRRTA